MLILQLLTKRTSIAIGKKTFVPCLQVKIVLTGTLPRLQAIFDFHPCPKYYFLLDRHDEVHFPERFSGAFFCGDHRLVEAKPRWR
ncbi:MAG: hypothetical protein ACOY4H_08425 [Thermodesulfobacteriota bacterium]